MGFCFYPSSYSVGFLTSVQQIGNLKSGTFGNYRKSNLLDNLTANLKTFVSVFVNCISSKSFFIVNNRASVLIYTFLIHIILTLDTSTSRKNNQKRQIYINLKSIMLNLFD
jgi:hypothetical protein